MKILTVIFVFLICFSCSTYKVNPIEKRYLLKDEGDAKYYLVELIRKAQIEHKLGEEPMLIIDGIPVYYHYRKDFVSIKL